MIAVSVIARTTPLEKRPLWQGMLGGIECLAIAFSPLIGGAIVDYTSWRICFYISIAVAAVALLLILLLFQHVRSPPEADLAFQQKLQHLGLLDSLLLLPTMVCLVLFLSWGGTSYSWKSFQTLLPLALFIAFACGFVLFQIWRGDKAMLPPRLLRCGSLSFAAIYGACNSSVLFIMAYYVRLFIQLPHCLGFQIDTSYTNWPCLIQLPMWFQTVHRDTPLRKILTCPGYFHCMNFRDLL